MLLGSTGALVTQDMVQRSLSTCYVVLGAADLFPRALGVSPSSQNLPGPRIQYGQPSTEDIRASRDVTQTPDRTLDVNMRHGGPPQLKGTA